MHFQPHQKKQVGFLVIFFSFVFGVAIAMSVLNQQASRKKLNNFVSSQDSKQTFNGVETNATVVSIDTQKYFFSVRYDFNPAGQYADPATGNPIVDITIIVGSEKMQFQAGIPMNGKIINIFIQQGLTNSYPLDEYFTDFSVQAYAGKFRLPTQLSLGGSVMGYSLSFNSENVTALDGTLAIGAIKAERGLTTKFFSVFIVICMWLLSCSVFTLACTVWFSDGKIEPPTIGLSAALLFAMPAIRNTQPGVPSIGCTIDTAGFLWNMFLVLTACLMLMWNYIAKYTGGKSAPPKARDLLA